MADANQVNRRTAVKAASLGALAAFTQPVAFVRGAESTSAGPHIKQSICRWCYPKIPLEQLANEAKYLRR